MAGTSPLRGTLVYQRPPYVQPQTISSRALFTGIAVGLQADRVSVRSILFRATLVVLTLALPDVKKRRDENPVGLHFPAESVEIRRVRSGSFQIVPSGVGPGILFITRLNESLRKSLLFVERRNNHTSLE